MYNTRSLSEVNAAHVIESNRQMVPHAEFERRQSNTTVVRRPAVGARTQPWTRSVDDLEITGAQAADCTSFSNSSFSRLLFHTEIILDLSSVVLLKLWFQTLLFNKLQRFFIGFRFGD